MPVISEQVQAAIKAANKVLASVEPIKIVGECLQFPPDVAERIFRAAITAALDAQGAPDSLARAENDAVKLAQRLDEANALIEELSSRLARYSDAQGAQWRELLTEARDEIDHYADTAREHDLVNRIDALLKAPDA